MANVDCNSCNNLRDYAPDFVQNGVTNSICTSLKNNTGLNPSLKVTHTNCADLDDANDCLVGIMDDQLESYDVCDWKEFMHQFIPNLHAVIKAEICSMCGEWNSIEKLQCVTNYLMSGASFYFGEETQTSTSKLIVGTGVDISLRSSADVHSSDVNITYVAGGLAFIGGSIYTFTESFKDASGTTKSGNVMWDWQHDMPAGGELLFEVRIKKSEYPQIKRFFVGHLFNGGGAEHSFYHAYCSYFNDKDSDGNPVYAYGQHGWCDTKTGTPSASGYSSGHQVADGYMYLQVRMISHGNLTTGNITDGSGAQKNGSAFSPNGYIGIRMNEAKIEC